VELDGIVRKRSLGVHADAADEAVARADPAAFADDGAVQLRACPDAALATTMLRSTCACAPTTTPAWITDSRIVAPSPTTAPEPSTASGPTRAQASTRAFSPM
jgi:hypothetical protein